jgi:thiamine biosynthesis lipoprotein
MSVTVIAPNGITADSLTKVVCVLGPDKGFALVEKVPGVSSRMVRFGDDGKRVLSTSPRFPRE